MTNSFIEWSRVFTEEEIDDIRRLFDVHAGLSTQSFIAIPPDNESAAWIVARLCALAVEADKIAGWGLLDGAGVQTDAIVYDRFGPKFSDPEFKWHVDAGPTDPRLVSVVAYLSGSEEFEGGKLLMETARVSTSLDEANTSATSPCFLDVNLAINDKLQDMGASTAAREVEARPSPTSLPPNIAERRYSRGCAVAFPSKTLRHTVTPVTAGERRSVLLLVGKSDSLQGWYVG